MFVTRCECCGQATIRAIRAETGEKIWSDEHSPFNDQTFEDTVFVDYSGDALIAPGVTCVQDGVELLAFGNQVGERDRDSDIQYGYIARYTDRGDSNDFEDYSSEFAAVAGGRYPFESTVRDSNGYWRVEFNRISRWGLDRELDVTLAMEWPGTVRQNGVENHVDVIQKQLRNPVTFKLGQVKDVLRFDVTLSAVQSFTDNNPGIELYAAGWVGDGKIVGLASTETEGKVAKLVRTDGTLTVDKTLELDEGSRLTPLEPGVCTSGGFAYAAVEDQQPIGPVVRTLLIFDVTGDMSVEGVESLNGECHFIRGFSGSAVLGVTGDAATERLVIQKWVGAENVWKTPLSSIGGRVYNAIELEGGDLIVLGVWFNEDYDTRQAARLDGETGEVVWDLQHSVTEAPLYNAASGPDGCILYVVGNAGTLEEEGSVVRSE
ncbi:hypothetical protein KOR42_22550 [Thalassoglobus neptunius]|uniref:Uncharacterized protein n=1 Tax=Thalassoglobus neptunius TaxID=1938619 RepID=A0A5C5X7U7_9PLAN|nr:hypothetical protein [Thalassoglobus neptunius]TWT58868.1 hypothetical protein KOR42_22550 [Thalassoglobus neptunius]